jgi:hypothetical protein
MNAFDEANGEMLLALPESERPTNGNAAYLWILEALSQKGQKNKSNLPSATGTAVAKRHSTFCTFIRRAGEELLSRGQGPAQLACIEMQW